MELMQVYKKNRGVKELFSKTIYIDWYDGITTGICKLDTSEKWFICNLCYLNPGERIRIFTLLKINDEWLTKFNLQNDMPETPNERNYYLIKDLIKSYFFEYTGKVFLMKGKQPDDIDYEVVEIPLIDLQYFDGIEMTLDQDEKLQEKWLNFFT